MLSSAVPETCRKATLLSLLKEGIEVIRRHDRTNYLGDEVAAKGKKG
jgi:hypothetical protein